MFALKVLGLFLPALGLDLLIGLVVAPSGLDLQVLLTSLVSGLFSRLVFAGIRIIFAHARLGLAHIGLVFSSCWAWILLVLSCFAYI